MHEYEKHAHPLTELKGKLVDLCEEEMDKGTECVDTEEFGKVIDMIKDLASAEKNCWKAAYYKEVVKAMKEGEEMPDDLPLYMETERAGYDRYRYPSSGRFAPKGSGRRYGYIPTPHGDWHMKPQEDEEDFPDGMPFHDGYGSTYMNYKMARRHYTDSHDKHDKEEMDKKAKEHVAEATTTMRDIWKDADPELRRKMKADLSALLNEMNG